METQDSSPKPNTIDRAAIIVRTSVVGIVTNASLAAAKAVVGIASNSIAITVDALNNFADAISSIVAIGGMHFAKKTPNKKHPLGYARSEYLSALIVAGLVLYAGITSAVESIKNIFEPETPNFGPAALTVIGVAIFVKAALGKYVKAQGKKVNSGALLASGSDALFDAVLSTSVLVTAIVYLVFDVTLEAYLGAVIGCFIIKSGIGMMRDALDEILGKRTDSKLTAKIKKLLTEEPAVRGAYDLVLHDYGPGKNLASVHVELPDSMSVKDADYLSRKLETRVYEETGVIITSVGIYSYNTKDDEAARIRDDVVERALAHDWALQVHGFYLDSATKSMRFDVVLSFDVAPQEGLEILQKEMNAAYPDYAVHIVTDVDISD